jgi:hypothetical protein
VILPFKILANILLGVDMQHSCTDVFPGKEGGTHVLAGLAPSCQKVGSLIRNPLAGKASVKMINFANIFFQQLYLKNKTNYQLFVKITLKVKQFSTFLEKLLFYKNK